MASDEIIRACSSGDIGFISQYLNDLNIIPDTIYIQNLLEAAVSNAHAEIVTLLISKFPSIVITEGTIRTSIRTGSTKILSALLEKDPSISKISFDRATPLSLAIGGHQPIELIKLLLSTGADPNDPEPTFPILGRAAAFYDTPDVVRVLVQYGAELAGSYALLSAAQMGHLETVRYLLEVGASPATDGEEGNPSEPVLNIAVEKGHHEIVKLLIAHGSDPNVVDYMGKTAIEIAGEVHPEMLGLLRRNFP